MTAAEAAQAARPRWTWADTNLWYPGLLRAGVRVDRCHDLRLAHRVLRGSAWSASSALARRQADPWDTLQPVPAGGTQPPDDDGGTLFELDPAPRGAGPGGGRDVVLDGPACRAELDAQLDAVATSGAPGRLRLLLAAESAGALAAAEMHRAGVPWDAGRHDEVLRDQLGPRPGPGARPERMERLAADVRAALDAPTLNPDSMPDVLRALRRTGLAVTSTRSWELRQVDHPAIEPLLAYKKLSRLFSANGWAWLDAWVDHGRFRPEYVVGGVVTGRWGSSGGGALQVPKQVRDAVRADPGWLFVVADAAQLEPRVLTGLAHDDRMAEAGRGTDLYQGMVDTAVVDSRAHAKVGMLGAMYGGTTGASAAVLPRLARAFPQALALVEDAARTGERGDVVTTLLGRTSPRPGASWHETQVLAQSDDADAGAESKARAQTRAWGRFTRNFVVQGTAAEWALCWIAEVRRRLWALGVVDDDTPGLAAAPFTSRPHLVYFLHDELVVHTPAALADAVAAEVRDAAAASGRLLFGDYPVDFPVSVGVAASYGDAKDGG
ncbi:bifunctional 3'-5' exonuclease/DNA polymerase [Luteimicrobium sp. DT211]|uniref:bifunctional 3'-5' exonuclease/DNA polymerase n=1 Tax=Luteimicrobium sp. DT211 TaxID=3393412 RepID=UPI003CFA7548